MTPRHVSEDRLDAILAEARDMAVAERDSFLAHACGDDHALRDVIASILCEDDSVPNGFLGGDLDVRAESFRAFDGDDTVPERIGDYRIVREIGRGGMGVVYEAEQEQPRRRVAIKVVAPERATDESRRRFKFEAEVLGRLEHPGIGRIYEAGATDTSGARSHYLVMEFIDGTPLDDFCDAQSLTTLDRLDLMARVADAVQYAHQQGVIHRDIKPGNILVETRVASSETTTSLTRSTASESRGLPKVVDFGVACAVGDDAPARTLQTTSGQIIGTLAYMPPEQVSGQRQDLDTRCDVYALGVVLYELLSGHLPHDLSGLGLAEAARRVTNDEPKRLGAIDPMFRGDIETIVAKAMHKERDARYASAAEFAADLRRHLLDEPIQARPATIIYQARKFARRNRGLVAGALAAVVILVVGLFVTAGLYVQATRASRDAHERAEDLTRLLEFQESAIQTADRRRMTVVLTDGLVALYERELAREGTDPALVEERLEAYRATLDDGDLYAITGQMLESGLFDNTLEAARTELSDRPVALVRFLIELSHQYTELTSMDRALETAESAFELARTQLPAHAPETIEAAQRAGGLLMVNGRLADAIVVFDWGIEHATGRDDRKVEVLRRYRAVASRRLGRYEDAIGDLEALYAEIDVIDNGHVLGIVSDLGECHREAGNLERAETLAREALDACMRMYPGHEAIRYMHHGRLGDVIMAAGKDEEAEEQLRIRYEGAADTMGVSTQIVIQAGISLFRFYVARDRLEEAAALEPDLVHAVDESIDVTRNTRHSLLLGRSTIADRQGRADDAARLRDEAARLETQ